jgi:CBS domain-containing protein
MGRYPARKCRLGPKLRKLLASARHSDYDGWGVPSLFSQTGTGRTAVKCLELATPGNKIGHPVEPGKGGEMANRSAADIMSPVVVTLSPADNIYDAMHTLLKKKISSAPVVNDEGGLVGMLSEKDCLRILTAEAFEGLPQGTVAGYMTESVETLTPEVSVYDIVHHFLERTFHQMPVVDEKGRVLGQVSRRDVLVAIESMRDNSYLYGTADRQLPSEEGAGVDSAMKRARGR